jgi:hypothetical protein
MRVGDKRLKEIIREEIIRRVLSEQVPKHQQSLRESLLIEGARVGGLEKVDGKWIFYQKQRFARSAEPEPVPLAPVLNHFGVSISPSDEVDLYYYRRPNDDPADYGNYHVSLANARNGLKSFTYKPDIGLKRISLHDLKLSGRTTRIIMFVPKKRHDEPGTILE